MATPRFSASWKDITLSTKLDLTRACAVLLYLKEVSSTRAQNSTAVVNRNKYLLVESV